MRGSRSWTTVLGGSSGAGPLSPSSPEPDLRRRRRRRRRVPISDEAVSSVSLSVSSESVVSASAASSSPSVWPRLSAPPGSPRPRPRPVGRGGADGQRDARPVLRRAQRRRSHRSRRRCRRSPSPPRSVAAPQIAACTPDVRPRSQASTGTRLVGLCRLTVRGIARRGGQQVAHPDGIDPVHR
ncbi:hypothetical protein I552_9449 [Mycobacterium xenopi 3993]|nr:hypothetical protein I552_9449 [Mycobacterium xenopi 3993]